MFYGPAEVPHSRIGTRCQYGSPSSLCFAPLEKGAWSGACLATDIAEKRHALTSRTAVPFDFPPCLPVRPRASPRYPGADSSINSGTLSKLRTASQTVLVTILATPQIEHFPGCLFNPKSPAILVTWRSFMRTLEILSSFRRQSS